MNTFYIKFNTVCLELDLIVTASDNHRHFKIELVTGEPNPMTLKRSDTGEWSILHPGGRTILDNRYQEIGTSIDQYLTAN